MKIVYFLIFVMAHSDKLYSQLNIGDGIYDCYYYPYFEKDTSLHNDSSVILVPVVKDSLFLNEKITISIIKNCSKKEYKKMIRRLGESFSIFTYYEELNHGYANHWYFQDFIFKNADKPINNFSYSRLLLYWNDKLFGLDYSVQIPYNWLNPNAKWNNSYLHFRKKIETIEEIFNSFK
jgi:hypothetical protein